MSLEQILHRISEQQDALRASLLTDAAFRSGILGVLSELLDQGLDFRITVNRKNPSQQLQSYRAGAASEREDQPDRKQVSTEESATVSVIEIWRQGRIRAVQGEIDNCAGRLGELANSHWGSRDPMTLLPYFKNPGVDEKLLAFASSLSAGEGRVAVLHTDLDRFKEINTALTETGGDAVIGEFAERLRRHFPRYGIVVRKGGDEFSAVIAGANAAELLSTTESFRLTMESEPFAALGRPNTCSVGLAIYDPAGMERICGSVDDLLRDARDAEQLAKDAGRNRVRLPRTDATPARAHGCQGLSLAAIKARVSLEREPENLFGEFGTALSGMLSRQLAEARPGEASTIIERVAGTFGISLGPLAGAAGVLTATLPVEEWAAIVAWALLRSAFAGGHYLEPDDELSFRPGGSGGRDLQLLIAKASGQSETIVIAANVCDGVWQAPVVIGRPWYGSTSPSEGRILRWEDRSSGTANLDSSLLSPCLLLPIGDAAISIAKTFRRLVADIVEIDDRPVIGGGLPDFWQSNVARIVRACLRNPNITSIIALGNAASASSTLGRLDVSSEAWQTQIHDLQRRLSIGSENLIFFRDRALHVSTVPDVGQEAVSTAIIGATVAVLPHTALGPAVDIATETRRRRLGLAPPSEDNRLLVTDGLRTGTLADAYPQAIQLLRASDATAQTETTQRRFREFPCFKLVLTTPFLETVPDYWKSETSALEHYYRNNFGRDDGIFGGPLRSAAGSEGSIYDHAVRTCVSALREGKPTRRLMLPIAAGSVRFEQPLGLCAIQVMPRLRDGRWYLDFQWIWRTVEALVGLPFSAFGSIAWSRDFFNDVRAENDRTERPAALELGELTYVALSFHMFLDVGDTEIARAIVQNASL
jgi:diguanylate cyclase (GGDEF)-like protein